MDKIIARSLKFTAYHGALPQEKLHPQPFIVDLEMNVDLSAAGKSDYLLDTINYAEVYEVVKKIVLGKSYNLIEALAENIATAVLKNFPVKEVKVKVYKPKAPINGDFDYFAVEISRFRK